MRDGGHTIPVKLLSQLGLSVSPPCSTNSSMGLGVMWSDRLKMVMWIELTSPWEENMTTWYFEKHDRYRSIVNAAEGNGWKVVPLYVEGGCRGYINDKWHHMTRALKLDKQMNKRLKNAVSDVAVRCSYFLYVCLRRREWCTTKLLGREQEK